jgi:anti-sigma B factor antagonist
MSETLKSVRRKGTATIAVPFGEVDLQRSPALYRELLQLCDARPKKLVIDLREVTYMDSSGVSTLVEIFRRTKSFAGELVLLAPTARVRSMFEIAKLDHFFTIVDGEEEALEL